MRNKRILITGATGFIGAALMAELSSFNDVIGIAHTECDNIEAVDLGSDRDLRVFMEDKNFDCVIHCAAIAHQKFGAVDRSEYYSVNRDATLTLAQSVSAVNPDVRFVFLSSVNVYGEKGQAGNSSFKGWGSEESSCAPSGDYAESKLEAEQQLIKLNEKGLLKHLDVLRLAPVYDRGWSLNLDRRVFGATKKVYIRFGTGEQLMSALARPNLVDFIVYLLKQAPGDNVQLFNVCDAQPYSFSSIIETFKNSGIHSLNPVVSVPLLPVWLATRIVGMIFRKNRNWLHACYDKLAGDLVYDNHRMLETGFRPQHSLKTIFFKR